MDDRQFATAGRWAIASDGHQWILQKGRMKDGGQTWRNVAFFRSTKDILARCLRENGADAETIRQLLAELPDSFDEWAGKPLKSWSEKVSAPDPSPGPKSLLRGVVPDSVFPDMYRLKQPDGTLSDMVNLTRAIDGMQRIRPAKANPQRPKRLDDAFTRLSDPPAA